MRKLMLLALLAVFLMGCQQQFTGNAIIACSDSDGGAVFDVLGRTADHKLVIADACGPTLSTGGQVLYEGICTPDGAEYMTWVCKQGCFNGMCIP